MMCGMNDTDTVLEELHKALPPEHWFELKSPMPPDTKWVLDVCRDGDYLPVASTEGDTIYEAVAAFLYDPAK